MYTFQPQKYFFSINHIFTKPNPQSLFKPWWLAELVYEQLQIQEVESHKLTELG